MNININLWDDFVTICKKYLISSGFNLSNNSKSADEIVINYLNLNKRMVSQKPRIIHKPKGFQCPKKFEKSILAIEKSIQNGFDITPYLSKNINKLDYSDLMLNDWGIHHLHLGEKIKRGFIERTKNLLFVKFTEEEAYFIKIYDHNSWSKKEIIEIIHDNWSKIIQEHKCKNVISLSYNLTDDDVYNLRDSGVNSAIQLNDGSIYMTIGGGFATNGSSVEVTMKMMRYKKKLQHFENAIKNAVENEKSIFLNNQNEFKFTLELSENEAYAREELSNVIYKLE